MWVLTVGSMGHASSIALGIALRKSDKTIWCIDGDGAALMHMGAMAVIGKAAPENQIHVVINNEAHESVGGMPTAADTTDICGVAVACGYQYCTTVEGVAALQGELGKIRTKKGPVFLEVECAIGARGDLERPMSTRTRSLWPARENTWFCGGNGGLVE